MKGVRGSAGFEGASAQDARAGAANVVCGGQELPLGLNRTGSGHGDELVPTDNKVAHAHQRALAPRADQDIGSLGKSFLPTFAHPKRSSPPPFTREASV